MSQRNPEDILKSDHILGSMWVLALPMMVSGLVSALYNTVDSIFVGRYVGNLALAALAVNNVIQVTIIAMSNLFAVGVSSIISRALGARNKEKAKEALITGLAFGFVIMVMFAWTLLFNLDRVLLWIGSPPEVLAYSRQYGGVILWFAFIGPLNDILNSALRAGGRSQWVMGLMLAGAFTNIVLDALFIIVFKWGVFGAALATVIAQVLVFAGAFNIVKKVYNLSLASSLSKIKLPLFAEIAYVGFPASVKSSIFALMNLSANRALIPFGADAIAGFGVIYKIIQLAYQPIFGFNLGVQPLIGYNYGAKCYGKVRKIITLSNTNAILMGLLPTAFFLIAPKPVFQLFTHSDVIISYIRACSFMMGLTFYLYGFQMVSTGASMAMGHTVSSLLMACFRPAVMVAVMVVLPRYFGVNGVWLAFPVTDLCSTVLIALVLHRELLKLKEQEIQNLIGENTHA